MITEVQREYEGRKAAARRERRERIATACMAAIHSSDHACDLFNRAKNAVRAADALIAELDAT